jgi:hypothetical protein
MAVPGGLYGCGVEEIKMIECSEYRWNYVLSKRIIIIVIIIIIIMCPKLSARSRILPEFFLC